MGLLRQNVRIWWQPPRNITDRDMGRTVTFLELFYDLVYVVLIAQIAHSLAEHPTLEGVAGCSRWRRRPGFGVGILESTRDSVADRIDCAATGSDVLRDQGMGQHSSGVWSGSARTRRIAVSQLHQRRL